MSEDVDALVEERVAQLREIHRRRNDLLVEMFYLIKRKEDLSNIVALEDDKAELSEFMENMDIMKQPDVSHVAPLIKRVEDGSPVDRSTPVSERPVSENGSPHSPSSGSSMSESPASVAAQPLPEEAVFEEQTHAEVSDEVMEVDSTQETQGTAPSSQGPAVDPVTVIAAEILTDFEDSQPQPESSQPDVAMEDDETASSQPQAEPNTSSPPLVESNPVAAHIAHEAPPPPPTSAPEGPAHPVNAAEGVANVERTVSHTEAPLPIARIESQTTYLVAEAPSPALPPPDYTFDIEMSVSSSEVAEPQTIAPSQTYLKLPEYTIPPLKKLPMEYNRKGKPRPSKKKDKDKDGKQEWQPLGLAKWNAILRTNPVHKRVAKAPKCLSTRDWNIAMTELKLIRTFDRIDSLKDAGRWSFRQPKKQRGVLMKSHWDHLMDEMKWMRTDFREERKWKLAVAYTLAHAAVEWHQVKTMAERVERGICVLWSPGKRRNEDVQGEDHESDTQDIEVDEVVESRGDSTPANNENSDDESEDEQEKERQAVLNALEPSSALQDALDDADDAIAASQNLQPKSEEVEDTNALHLNALAEQARVDASRPPAALDEGQASSALRPGAGDAMLGDTSTSAVPIGSSLIPKSKSKSAAYAHLREQIIYSDVDKLFLDLDDFDLIKSMSDLTTDEGVHHAPPPPTDISAIFPDLQPYGLLDPPPVSALTDIKKKDRRGERDDPTKRADDTTYTKVVPLSKFMLQKTTLLGPLEPSTHWTEEGWHDLDDTTVSADFDTPAARPIDDSMASWLFEGNRALPSSASSISSFLTGTTPKRRGHEVVMDPRFIPGAGSSRAKHAESTWTPDEDVLLKRFVDKYPYNWMLIAEAFNTAKVAIPVERRSPMECFERWKVKFGPAATTEEDHKPPPTPTTSMTTRGTKRSLSTSVNASGGAGPSQFESRKKRRHNIMHDAIRKVAKKREQAQRANAANQQRKVNALNNMHDTHGQYARMPKKTPAELSRQKADADAAHNQQMMLERRRQEEMRNQQRIQEMQQRQQAMQAAQAGGMRLPNGLPAGQGVPQIRSQVNISGQQPRVALNALQLTSTRIANSSVMQARALQAAQAQQQGHPGVSQSLAAGAAPALNAHLSPPFNGQRTASTSPGAGQQSPPPVAAQSTATSPRPPSAQAQVQAQAQAQQAQAHLSMPQVQSPMQRAALANYYASLQHTGHLTPEQMAQAAHMRNIILQQQALQQQQQAQAQAQAAQAQQQAQQQQQQNGF